MKGFGIEIKNTLLDPKHIKTMGSAIWLYMWLVDKMTSIGEDQVGKVLGGRPVKFEEIQKELGISKNTYSRWISKLKAYPYIETTLAPQGVIFRVFKAHKRFGKSFPINGEPLKKGNALKKAILKNSGSPKPGSASPKSGNLRTDFGEPNIRHNSIQD